jgi:hypothetical protein
VGNGQPGKGRRIRRRSRPGRRTDARRGAGAGSCRIRSKRGHRRYVGYASTHDVVADGLLTLYVLGSTAAGVQSGIGSVVAPSVFATLQSAAAGGYGVVAVSATVQGLGGVVASSAGAMSIFTKGKKHKNEDEDEDAATEGDESSIVDDEADKEEKNYNDANKENGASIKGRL